MAAPSGGARHFVRADDLNDVARRAADLFVTIADAAIRARGRFDVALSGGSTPRALHALLASAPYRDQVEWQRVQFYWGDERCVPPDNAESNFRMGQETLLSLLPIQQGQVHRMRGELPPDEAAARYEQELRETMGLAPGQLPRFDLLILGMGPDGHTLSLFPQTAALHVTDRSRHRELCSQARLAPHHADLSRRQQRRERRFPRRRRGQGGGAGRRARRPARHRDLPFAIDRADRWRVVLVRRSGGGGQPAREIRVRRTRRRTAAL